MDKKTALTIHTSNEKWLPTLTRAYSSKTAVLLVDDAGLGIDPVSQTLLEMGRKANLSQREWIAVLTSLGIGAAGAYLLVMAILDPEPFSKIGLALGTGALLITTGGFSAIRVLVGHKPPNVSFNGIGFDIRFD